MKGQCAYAVLCVCVCECLCQGGKCVPVCQTKQTKPLCLQLPFTKDIHIDVWLGADSCEAVTCCP